MKEKITLSLDQHENARHGEEIFPLQKYVTPLWKEYPYVTAHWHEEAEFTRIEKGSCTYQIHLETYDVEEGDLIFIPPAVLHAISNEKEERMQSETYVFHMDFLGAKAADICAIRYLNPLMNQKLIPPFVIEKAADLFEDINTEYDKKTPGYEIAIKSYLLQFVAALIPYCTRNTEAGAILTEHAKKLKEVLSYIDAHYMEELTISGLAGICFLCVFSKNTWECHACSTSKMCVWSVRQTSLKMGRQIRSRWRFPVDFRICLISIGSLKRNME